MEVFLLMSHRIVAVVKDNKGEICAYKMDNNIIIQKQDAVHMARRGEIEGVMVGVSKVGEEYLRSMPDGTTNNNLDSLPVVSTDEAKFD